MPEDDCTHLHTYTQSDPSHESPLTRLLENSFVQMLRGAGARSSGWQATAAAASTRLAAQARPSPPPRARHDLPRQSRGRHARSSWNDLRLTPQCMATRSKPSGGFLVWVDILLVSGACRQPRRVGDDRAGAVGAVLRDVGVALREETLTRWWLRVIGAAAGRGCSTDGSESA